MIFLIGRYNVSDDKDALKNILLNVIKSFLKFFSVSKIVSRAFIRFFFSTCKGYVSELIH